MDRLDFYMKVYDDEISTKDSINSRAQIVLGLIQLLIPAFIFFWIDSIGVSEKYIVIFTLDIEGLQVSYIDCFVCIYRLFSMILDYEKTLQQSYHQNKDYYSSNHIREENFIADEMENYLVRKLSEATDKNQEANENKLWWMNGTYHAIAWALGFALCCLVMYLIGSCF